MDQGFKFQPETKEKEEEKGVGKEEERGDGIKGGRGVCEGRGDSYCLSLHEARVVMTRGGSGSDRRRWKRQRHGQVAPSKQWKEREVLFDVIFF